MAPLVSSFSIDPVVRDFDIFQPLTRSIISQQLSTKVARVIYDRFCDLFENNIPDIETLQEISHEELRSVGLSRQKANYIYNVSEYFQQHPKEVWDEYSDEEIIERLTQIKGVGIWTVQMILIFTLGREDVFPVNDHGIQVAMRDLYGLESSGKEFLMEMDSIAESYQPYRSYASRYLWKHKDLKL